VCGVRCAMCAFHCRWLDGQPVTLDIPGSAPAGASLPSAGCLAIGQRATGCETTDASNPSQLAFTGFDPTMRWRQGAFVRVVLFEEALAPEDLPCLLEDCTVDTCGGDTVPIHSWGASDWAGAEQSVVTDMGWRSKDLSVSILLPRPLPFLLP
jgi:hypothetical protein